MSVRHPIAETRHAGKIQRRTKTQLSIHPGHGAAFALADAQQTNVGHITIHIDRSLEQARGRQDEIRIFGGLETHQWQPGGIVDRCERDIHRRLGEAAMTIRDQVNKTRRAGVVSLRREMDQAIA